MLPARFLDAAALQVVLRRFRHPEEEEGEDDWHGGAQQVEHQVRDESTNHVGELDACHDHELEKGAQGAAHLLVGDFTYVHGTGDGEHAAAEADHHAPHVQHLHLKNNSHKMNYLV